VHKRKYINTVEGNFLLPSEKQVSMVSLKHAHIMMIVVLLAMLVTPVLAQDPTGAETLEGDPNAPVNFAWTLICGFLVMFMQAGFAMVETGLTRAKNAANILMKNLTDFAFGALSYWAVGFALMFGTASGITALLVGTDGFFLLGEGGQSGWACPAGRLRREHH